MAAHERLVRVGVTGHRTFDDPRGTAARVRSALGRLLALAGEGAAGAPVRLEVVTPLADGADRLVAREVLAVPGTTLVAALPFAAGEYESDFETAESRREFRDLLERASSVAVMPPVATREEGYAQVGRWVIAHADVLAVWDGRPARGEGGTADMVAHAADGGLPLVWVRVTRS